MGGQVALFDQAVHRIDRAPLGLVGLDERVGRTADLALDRGAVGSQQVSPGSGGREHLGQQVEHRAPKA
ncbi:MAG: hypothetical protein ACFCVG_10430 [Kineosporiaceae bacterium]